MESISDVSDRKPKFWERAVVIVGGCLGGILAWMVFPELEITDGAFLGFMSGLAIIGGTRLVLYLRARRTKDDFWRGTNSD